MKDLFNFPDKNELKTGSSRSPEMIRKGCIGEMCPMGPLTRNSQRTPVSLILLGAAAQSVAPSVMESGISPTLCLNTNEAVAALKQLPYQAVLCDLKLPGAEKFMRDVRANFPSVAVLVLTQPGDLRGGILATLSGASGYIQAPLVAEDVTTVLLNAVERKRLESAILSNGTR